MKNKNSMNNMSWMDHPSVKKMDKRKLEVLQELAKESEGLSVEKSLPLLMKTNAKLKAMDISFTKEESGILVDVLSQNMTPADRAKLDKMKTMMGMMKN